MLTHALIIICLLTSIDHTEQRRMLVIIVPNKAAVWSNAISNFCFRPFGSLFRQLTIKSMLCWQYVSGILVANVLVDC